MDGSPLPAPANPDPSYPRSLPYPSTVLALLAKDPRLAHLAPEVSPEPVEDWKPLLEDAYYEPDTAPRVLATVRLQLRVFVDRCLRVPEVPEGRLLVVERSPLFQTAFLDANLEVGIP